MTLRIALRPWPCIAVLASLSSCITLEPGTDRRDGGAVPTDALSHVDTGADDAGDLDGGQSGCPPLEAREVRDIGLGDGGAVDVTYEGDETWECRYVHQIHGNVIQASGTLTIEPGTVVRVGDRRFILISRGASIEAIGTADAPIRMEPATRPAARGQWRGLLLLGSAPNVFGTNGTLAGTTSAGIYARYGGSDAASSCGRLDYVTISFAGGALSDYFVPVGGLTLAGCGRATRVEHVQVHASTDGIGLIGGSAPISRVVVTDPQEDGIEWTGGYAGLIQFAIVQSFYGTSAALKGTQQEGAPDSAPASEPAVYNVTLVGAREASPVRPTRPVNGVETGILLAGGTRGVIRNSYVAGFRWWANVGDSDTTPRLTSGAAGVRVTMMADRDPGAGGGLPGAGDEDPEGDGAFDESAFFAATEHRNRVGVATALYDPYDRGAPSFMGPNDLASGSFDEGPAEWAGVYVDADYYGAFEGAPDAQTNRVRLDWTVTGTDGASGVTTWLVFPQE